MVNNFQITVALLLCIVIIIIFVQNSLYYMVLFL